MAEVHIKSDLVQDRYDPTSVAPDPKRARGRQIASSGIVTNAADDSSGSSYHLVDLPSDVILLRETYFDVENWGFDQVVIGTKTDTDALVDQTKATEAIADPITRRVEFHGKALWEILGLAEDPRCPIGIYAHAEADATAAGTMLFGIYYLDD